MSFNGQAVSLERIAGDFDQNQIEDLFAFVGPNTEFPNIVNADRPGGIVVINADINLGNTTVVFQINDAGAFRFPNLDGFNGYIVRDTDGGILPITGIEIVESENTFGLPLDRVAFNKDAIFFNLNDLPFQNGDAFTLSVDFAPFEEANTATDDALFVARLYTATFGRDPDVLGLNFWINQFDALGREDLVIRFLVSDEFKERFGAPQDLTDRQFVEVMYDNVLGRPGELAGITFWTDLLERDVIDRFDTLDFFVSSPENVDNTERFDEGLAQNAATGEWDIFV